MAWLRLRSIAVFSLKDTVTEPRLSAFSRQALWLKGDEYGNTAGDVPNTRSPPR
jgi:hypothetical protein